MRGFFLPVEHQCSATQQQLYWLLPTLTCFTFSVEQGWRVWELLIKELADVKRFTQPLASTVQRWHLQGTAI